MPSHAQAERQVLAQALADAGPDAPTLCEGWRTRDLAAHLVARERRPDSMPGLVVKPLAGWTDKVRQSYANRPYEELVEAFRGGPPRLSLAGIPGADAAMNTTEFFVHAEDVLRARGDWAPRELPGERQDALWRGLRTAGRLLFRHSPVGVTLVTPDGRRETVITKPDGVELHGEPAELTLYAMGRGSHARVEVTGSADAVDAFGKVPLGT